MQKKITRRAAGAASVLCLTGLITTLPTLASAASVPAQPVDGNPTCESLGYDYGFKPGAGVAEDVAGQYTDPTYGITVDWSYAASDTKSTIDWTSSMPASAVIVKGGSGANLYAYDPAQGADKGLDTPVNASGGGAAVSHLVFCYNYAPTVTKTATTSYTRTYAWDITKSANPTALILAAGQTATVNYAVKVSQTPTDSDFAVTGTITVTNPWKKGATISVADSIPGAKVDCPATTVAAGGTLACTYTAPLTAKTDGTNVATVTANYGTKDRIVTATAPYTFGDPTTLTDDCVTVTDSLKGSLGTVCGADKTFEYPMEVGPYETAGSYTVHNVATFVTDDTKTEGSDSADVDVTVPATGCTLTQGYWKTHSQAGPAPYDDAWKALGSDEEKTVFYGSGKTWLQVFQTPPQGNAYYILADQYMAAKLNILNDAAASTEVQQAVAAAETLFASVPGTTLTREQATQAKQLATLLDNYNNGLSGTAHCSETPVQAS